MYEKYFKRLFDIICSSLGILILSPIFLILALLVRNKIGSPILFIQKRPGKNNKVFDMYKFRTMTNKKSENGDLLSDKLRMTKFGKILRSSSLDELPELINIFKGDMSIVGPRPQLVKDMVFMNEKQNLRHGVRQGLTGLAQVNGRNNISWESKLAYDVEYIQHITFMNDMRIIIQTIVKVFKREDVSTDGMETAQDFGDYLLRNNLITKEEYIAKIKESEEILNEVLKS